jgi:LPS-assembly protein
VRFVHDDVNLKDPTTYERTGVSYAKPGGARLDVKPYVSVPLSGAAWYVTPTLAWRYTAYDLDRKLADQLNGNTHPTRSLPIASIDAGVYFDRETSFGGTPYLQTLEPRLFYLKVPYRDQSDLPVFDTRDFTFSWGQLFRDSRYTGADRQNDANQLTLALTSALPAPIRRARKLSVSLGQIHYFDDSGGAAMKPGEEGPVGLGGRCQLHGQRPLDAGRRLPVRPEIPSEGSGKLPLAPADRRDGVLNLSYRYRHDLLDRPT